MSENEIVKAFTEIQGILFDKLEKIPKHKSFYCDGEANGLIYAINTIQEKKEELKNDNNR